jgi:hypothetical protein
LPITPRSATRRGDFRQEVEQSAWSLVQPSPFRILGTARPAGRPGEKWGGSEEGGPLPTICLSAKGYRIREWSRTEGRVSVPRLRCADGRMTNGTAISNSAIRAIFAPVLHTKFLTAYLAHPHFPVIVRGGISVNASMCFSVAGNAKCQTIGDIVG